jgi:membrane protease YdiL (CAAX protease family)
MYVLYYVQIEGRNYVEEVVMKNGMKNKDFDKKKINHEKLYLPAFILIFFISQGVYTFFYNYSSLRNNYFEQIIIRSSIWSGTVFAYIIFFRTNPFEYLKLRRNFLKGIIWGLIMVIIVIIYYYMNVYLSKGTLRFSFYRGMNSIIFDTLRTVVKAFGLFNIIFIFNEEIMFRGFIVQRISKLSKFWIGNILGAVLFALIHIQGWIIMGNFIIPISINTAVSIFIFALIQGIVLKKTNSLWACVLIHIINNAISTSII